jgi:predicted dehydrogenase
MANRREFLKAGAAALTAAAARPLFGWQGANNRVRMGVIGMGTRAARVFDSLTRNPDCEFLVGCEVVQTKLQSFVHPTMGGPRPLAEKMQIVGDYRRVLDRNDIDAVLIATPDFSHSKIAVDALAAGKHVYVEKPISNSVPRINSMIDAYNKSNLTVQVGTHQRSWDHFIQAKKLLEEKLDHVTHVLIQQPGAYSQNRQDPVEVPPGVDWDAWQVDAPKRPFKQGYLGFRGWWEYGSGLVGDWGAHHVDVANWFMNADTKAPLKTSAIGFYSTPDIDPECVYNTFSIAWQFDTHLVTFANSVYPRPNFNDSKSPDIEGWGVFFYAGNGTLQVNRMGYALRPPVQPTRNRVGPEPPTGAGNVQLGTGAAPAAAPPAGAPAGCRRGRWRRTRWSWPRRHGTCWRSRSRPRQQQASRRAGCLHQPTRRRRRGLPAARPHAQLPRLPEGEGQEDQRANGDRLQLGATVSARARSDAAEPHSQLGRNGEEIKTDIEGENSRPLFLNASFDSRKARTPRRPARHRLHGQGALERLLPGRAFLRSALSHPTDGHLRPPCGVGVGNGLSLGLGRVLD